MGSTSLRAVAVGGVVVAALALGLVWKLRDRGERASASRPASVAPATHDHHDERTPAPAALVTPTSPSEDVDEQGNPRPQPIPVAGSDVPAADTPHSQPAPPQKPFTREETIAKREADLK